MSQCPTRRGCGNLLARLRNADIGVCDEAADEIERLRAQVTELLGTRPPPTLITKPPTSAEAFPPDILEHLA